MKKSTPKIGTDELKLVLAILDFLALLLTKYKFVWPPTLKRQYNKVTKLLIANGAE